MLEPPPDIADDDVLAEVRRAWGDDVDGITYAPVGFGAHHWTAFVGAEPRLFVTLDELEPRRSAARLESAYTGAKTLRDAGLEFVLPPVTAATGVSTVRFSDGALSCTPWRHGTSGGALDSRWTADALTRLHAAPPPLGLPPWRPLVGPGFAEELASLTDGSWGPGPYAAEARRAVQAHLEDVARWSRRYQDLATVAGEHPWVATHGEPHSDNQLLTDEGRLLVDWESLKPGPAELDLRTLVDAGADPAEVGADQEMLELFDLEWRLDEIGQYAAWFAAPHSGTRDDEIAIGGLHDELVRPGAVTSALVTSDTGRNGCPRH